MSSWQGEIQLWQGEEIEFAITPRNRFNLTKTYVPELVQAIQEQDFCIRGGSQPLEYLWNGGRVYADEIANLGGGKHQIFEIATPECLGPFQLVLYDKAAEACAALAATSVGYEIHCYKTPLAETKGGYTTRGCHESYLVKKDLLDKLNLLIPYLVIRQIFCAAGGYYKGQFVLSPRQMFVETPISSLSYPVPMVFCRYESHAGPDEFRLQILNGEGTRSEHSTLLRFGITALIIRCIQEGLITDLPEIQDPVGTSRNLSLGWDKGWWINLVNGKSITALDYFNEHLLPPLEKLFREGEPNSEDYDLRQRMLKTLQALEARNLDYLASTLDWALKVQSIENEETFAQIFDLELNPAEVMEIIEQQKTANYSYTAVTERTFEALSECWEMARLVSSEAVTKALREPPPCSRGQLRSKVGSKFGPHLESMSWDKAVIAGKEYSWDQLLWTEEQIAEHLALIRGNLKKSSSGRGEFID